VTSTPLTIYTTSGYLAFFSRQLNENLHSSLIFHIILTWC